MTKIKRLTIPVFLRMWSNQNSDILLVDIILFYYCRTVQLLWEKLGRFLKP